ncbi:MAG: adenylate kinase [Ignavibacteria bacterium]
MFSKCILRKGSKIKTIEKNSLVRVNVVGSSGSGKTTFSKTLASKLNIPRIEMDEIFWDPDWQQPPDEVFFERVEKALSSESWVLDGNYTRTTHIKWKKVTAVVWLDYSYVRILFQTISRSFTNILTGREIWPNSGNKETLRAFFSKKSILLWTITNLGKIKKKYEFFITAPGYKQISFYRFRSPKEAKNFLNDI